MTTPGQTELPEDREELRKLYIARCEERIADGQRLANEAHKAQDWQNVALARHSIGESQRFLERLRADAPTTQLTGTLEKQPSPGTLGDEG